MPNQGRLKLRSCDGQTGGLYLQCGRKRRWGEWVGVSHLHCGGQKLNFAKTLWLKSEIYYLYLIYLFAKFMFILRINLQKVRTTPRRIITALQLIIIFWLWECLKLFNDSPSITQIYSIRVISESYQDHTRPHFGLKNSQPPSIANEIKSVNGFWFCNSTHLSTVWWCPCHQRQGLCRPGIAIQFEFIRRRDKEEMEQGFRWRLVMDLNGTNEWTWMTIGMVVIHLKSVQKFDEIFRSIILENCQLKLMLFILSWLSCGHFFWVLLMFEQVFQFSQKC